MTIPILLGLLGALANPIQTVGRREPVASIPVQLARAVEAVEISPGPPFLKGRLLDEWGTPLAGWSVGVQTTYFCIVPSRESVHSLTDEAGRFVFHETMGRGLALVLRSPDDGTVAVRENFRLDGQDLVLRTGSEDRPTGFVEGLLVGQDGTRLEKPSIRVWNPETYRMAAAEFRGERFRVGPMPPGEYVLCAGAEGFPESLVLVQVEPYSTRDVGTLSLDWPGWIEVHLDCPGITLGPEEVVFTALFRDGGQWGALRDGPAAEKPPRGMCALGASIAEPLPPRGRSRPLAPGRYLLRTQHSSGVAPDVQVEVLPRRTTEVELALLPATTRTLVVKVAESDPAIRMKLKVNSCVGSYCWEYENAYRSRHNNFVFVVEGLVPDSYRVEASSPSSGRLVSEFEVLDLRPSPDVMLEF